MTKFLAILIFVASLAPHVALAACNADNVLRALRRASATSFCSTYTLPPTNQPLPTYVSAFPASRVSSGCSCLNTPTPTPTPTTPQCSGDLIRNGDFSNQINGRPEPWILSPPVNVNGQKASVSVLNGAVQLLIDNPGPVHDFSSVSANIKQNIPGFCPGTTYILTYSTQIFIRGGEPHLACNANIDLGGGSLVAIGPPNGDIPPFSYETRSLTFEYSGNVAPTTLSVSFRCSAPGGGFLVSDISLVGQQVPEEE